MKTVGIIGGLGPETTSEFYLQVLLGCQEVVTEGRPRILISSVPMSFDVENSFILQNLGHKEYVEYLQEEARRLEAAGADFLVIPCNSVHAFIDDVRSAIGIPILSITEETSRFIKSKGLSRVALISTSATIENGVYEKVFRRDGISYIIPDENQQSNINKFILNLVHGRHGDADRKELMEIIGAFEEKEIDCVALACTDLQLLTPHHPKLTILDTMNILVRATVREVTS